MNIINTIDNLVSIHNSTFMYHKEKVVYWLNQTFICTCVIKVFYFK